MNKLLILLAIMVIAAPIVAAEDVILSLQGVLKDNGGNVLAGRVVTAILNGNTSRSNPTETNGAFEMLLVDDLECGTHQEVELRVDGTVVGTFPFIACNSPTGNLNVPGNLLVDGQKPIFFKHFSNLGDNINYNTQIPADLYECGVAGLYAEDGDIQEDSAGDIIKAYAHVPSGNDYWHIRADFRTHNNNEDWDIWVICVNKALAQQGMPS